jgi:hypothetical protein
MMANLPLALLTPVTTGFIDTGGAPLVVNFFANFQE